MAKTKLMRKGPPSQDPAGNGLFSRDIDRLKRMEESVERAQTGKGKKKKK